MHRMTQDQLNERLLQAVKDDDIEAAKEAIEAGADVNATDEDGRTLLHKAAVVGGIEKAKVLIEAGADIKAKDRWGETPLDKAEFALDQAKKNVQNAEETIALLKKHGGV